VILAKQHESHETVRSRGRHNILLDASRSNSGTHCRYIPFVDGVVRSCYVIGHGRRNRQSHAAATILFVGLLIGHRRHPAVIVTFCVRSWLQKSVPYCFPAMSFLTLPCFQDRILVDPPIRTLRLRLRCQITSEWNKRHAEYKQRRYLSEARISRCY
jgi:hypothetical protein